MNILTSVDAVPLVAVLFGLIICGIALTASVVALVIKNKGLFFKAYYVACLTGIPVGVWGLWLLLGEWLKSLFR